MSQDQFDELMEAFDTLMSKMDGTDFEYMQETVLELKEQVIGEIEDCE